MVSEGLSARLVLPDACLDQALIDAAGPSNVNGRVFATFGGLPAERLVGKGAAFVQHYRQRYGTAPEAYAIYGYVSAQVALDAIAHVGRKDREAVRQAIAASQQKDGPLGTWHFAPTGDTTLTLVSGSVARDGKFVFDTFLDAQESAR
jgi:branched-chain amino acid transport system substrate-binding protein